jgi:membrane protein implicated in regulation of membrane protease activity
MQRFLPDWWFREPAAAGAALVVFVNSVIALAVALGWLNLDTTALALVYLVVLNGVVLFVGNEVRNRVTPTGRDPVDPEPPA